MVRHENSPRPSSVVHWGLKDARTGKNNHGVTFHPTRTQQIPRNPDPSIVNAFISAVVSDVPRQLEKATY